MLTQHALHPRMRRNLFSLLGLLLCGCYSGGLPYEGLTPRHEEDVGPKIVWDINATPLPEIPFPNDIATREDRDSPTGVRVNVSTRATTQHESRLRRIINQLDGFGTFSPLWVQFSGRLDVERLHALQNDDDPNNDAIYLINIDPDSENYGERVALDVGGGAYPLVLDRKKDYFLNDARGDASNVLLETYEEDSNENGELDPGEDTDGDGHLDHPNLWGEALGLDGRRHPSKDLITFYEMETDTLVFRPLLHLEEASRYAVVLTRRLVGQDSGSPIQPPEGFDYINHPKQTGQLRALTDANLLEPLGVSLDDVAFAWSFTTQSIVEPLRKLRAGLYGEGPFARFARDFPPELTRVWPLQEQENTDNVHILPPSELLRVIDEFRVVDLFGLPERVIDVLEDSYLDYVDYIVNVEFESPAFLYNPTGAIDANYETGEVDYGRESIYMTCVVPKAGRGNEPPFPVIVDVHGTGLFRLQLLGYASINARFGFATCAIDAYGHGVPGEVAPILGPALEPYDLKPLGDAVSTGRLRDTNKDGVGESGSEFWTANIAKTRDVVRQTVIDHHQMVRILRRFGTGTMPVDVNGDGENELMGDFNADGVADLGGEQAYYLRGQSLGGLVGLVVAATEPLIEDIHHVSAGAGLVDISTRSRMGVVISAVYGPVLGTMITLRPADDDGELELAFLAKNVFDVEVLPFAHVPAANEAGVGGVRAGDRIRVTNLNSGELDEMRVQAEGSDMGARRARLHIATDKGDRLRVEFFRADATSPYDVIETFEREIFDFENRTYEVGEPLRALQDGFGFRRNTPELRRMFGIAQMVVDAADAANFAHLFRDPEPFPPDAAQPATMIAMGTTGDMIVPINTAVALARQADILRIDEVHPDYGMTRDQYLKEKWVVEGVERLRRFEDDPCHYSTRKANFDPDDLSEGLDQNQGPNPSTISRNPACEQEDPPAFCNTTCAPKPPLRITRERQHGADALRFVYSRPKGSHSLWVPDPNLDFDYNRYAVNQSNWFFKTEGQEVVDKLCLADAEAPCSFLPK